MRHRICLFVLLGIFVSQPFAAQSKPRRPLTLDRLYRLPSLIGTRPEQPMWSPDSHHLAFLWNDEGMPFLDVWLADAATGAAPQRLTRLPHPAAPADPGTDVDLLQAQERFETDRGVQDLAWSADSTNLFFTLHGQLYRVTAGSDAHPLPVTGVRQLLPAPVGDRLAYLAADGALSLLDPSTGAVTTLYRPPAKDVAVDEAYWSPDGTQLAFVETDSRAVPIRGIADNLTPETTLRPVRRAFPGEPSETRRLGIVGAGRQARWLPLPGAAADLIFGVSWSPNGRTLLLDRSDLYIKHRRLLLIDTATGSTSTLVAEDDPRNVTAEWWSAWAPDGRGIYYTSDQPPATDYAVVYKSLAAGQPVPVVSGDFAVFSAQIAAGGNALFATANPLHREERQTLRLDLKRPGAAVELRSTAGTHTAIASPDGRFLADTFSSDTVPPDLYLQRADAAANAETPRQITHSPLPEFADYTWMPATYVTFPNVHDGTVVHARMTLPPHFNPALPHPAILGSVYSNTARNQWGGRIFHPTWGLDQYLAQQGYVLLNPDIRGSSGYGRAFRQRLALDYGGIDVDDLYSGARFLAGTGFVDPERIGIWGSSYGGLLTATSLFTHPEVFRAGVAGAPATSLYHALTGEMRTMLDPQTHPAQYAASSAFLKSGGLQGHLMLLHGMRDETVLFKDSVTLTERLMLQGKDVTLTPLPNAPHGWDTEGLAQTRYAYRKLVDYFNRWLAAPQSVTGTP